MNLLLISNSTNAGEEYLKYPIGEIAKTLEGVSEVVFIPYAAVTFSYDEYEAKVQNRLNEIGIKDRESQEIVLEYIVNLARLGIECVNYKHKTLINNELQ